MEFTFLGLENGFRSGCIEDNLGRKFETPHCLLYTKSGSAPYLSQDVLKRAKLVPAILQMPANHFCEHVESLTKFEKGLSNFTANQGLPIFCSLQDPAAPVPSGYNDSKGVAMWNKSGKFKMMPDQYLAFMEICQPAWFQALSDSDTDENSSKKRIMKSVDRTLNYLDECIDLLSKSEKLNGKIIATLEGGYDMYERIRSATETAKRNVYGFCLEGFHNLGSASEKFRLSSVENIVRPVMEVLPKGKLRMVSGVHSPLQVIEAYKTGFDVFNSSYPYLATECGGALNFNLNLDEEFTGSADEDNILFLKDIKYSKDFGPILKGCACLACLQHSRAYINHLLTVSELLARILLMIHNFHHYTEFFKVLRKASKMNLIEKLEKNITSRTTPSLHMLMSCCGGDATNVEC